MNRIFRIVWNSAHGTWTVASELASGTAVRSARQDPNHHRAQRGLLLAAAAIGGSVLAPAAFAQHASSASAASVNARLSDLDAVMNRYAPVAERAASTVSTVAPATRIVQRPQPMATGTAVRAPAIVRHVAAASGVDRGVLVVDEDGALHAGPSVSKVLRAAPVRRVASSLHTHASSALRALPATVVATAVERIPASTRSIRAHGVHAGVDLASASGGRIPVVATATALRGQKLADATLNLGDQHVSLPSNLVGDSPRATLGNVVQVARTTVKGADEVIGRVAGDLPGTPGGGDTGATVSAVLNRATGAVDGLAGRVLPGGVHVGADLDAASGGRIPVAVTATALHGQTLADATLNLGDQHVSLPSILVGDSPQATLGNVVQVARTTGKGTGEVIGRVAGDLPGLPGTPGGGDTGATVGAVLNRATGAVDGLAGRVLPGGVHVGADLDAASGGRIPVAVTATALHGQTLADATLRLGDQNVSLPSDLVGDSPQATLDNVGQVVRSSVRGTGEVVAHVAGLGGGQNPVGGVLDKAGQTVGDVVGTVTGGLGGGQNPVGGVLDKAGQTVGDVVGTVTGGLGGGQNPVGGVLDKAGQTVGDVVGTVTGGLGGGQNPVGGVLDKVGETVSGVVGTVAGDGLHADANLGEATGGKLPVDVSLTALDGRSSTLADATVKLGDQTVSLPTDLAGDSPQQTLDNVGDAVTSTVQGTGEVLDSAVGSHGLLALGGLLSPAASGPVATALPVGDDRRPPPPETPSPGLLIGTGGLLGSTGATLDPVTSALLDPSDPDYHAGALTLSKDNVTTAYGGGVDINVGGIGVTVPVSVVNTLSAVGGTVYGTGSNQHLTLLGGVHSGNYITDINNGATNGGILSSANPAWADSCVNVDIGGLLGVDVPCWGVNAAQNYQVLVGDGASANGSEEVVIGTGASHTLPDESANDVFPGDGNRDSATDPMGVPNSDYASRKGHSVVIGDSASGTANAQTLLGAGATSDQVNSVALGYASNADRAPLSAYTDAYGLVGQAQDSAGAVSIGRTGYERQLTHVAAGSDDYDAVNVLQLKGAIASVSTGTDLFAVRYDDDGAGSPDFTRVTLGSGGGPTLLTNLADGAITATSTDAVNGGQLYHWTQDTTNLYSNVSLYNAIQNLGGGGGGGGGFVYDDTGGQGAPTAAGSDSAAGGAGATASGTASVAVGAGAQATADNSVALGAGSVADRADSVSVGAAGSERQITHVAAGTAATDAVNLSQLQQSRAGMVNYDTTNGGDIDYTSVTLGNPNGSGGPTTVHNVAAGTLDTDAVNVRQLDDAMDWSRNYTDQRFADFDRNLGNLRNRANAGIASAMALAGLPQAYMPGRNMAAVSAGSFRGESSVAIGVSTISDNGHWVYKLSGTANTRGDAGVALGAGMQW